MTGGPTQHRCPNLDAWPMADARRPDDVGTAKVVQESALNPFRGAQGAGLEGQSLCTIFLPELTKLGGDFIESLVPGYGGESSGCFLKRLSQPSGVMLVQVYIHPLAAGVAPAPGIGLVRADLDDPVILDLKMETAVGVTKTTARLVPGHGRLPEEFTLITAPNPKAVKY